MKADEFTAKIVGSWRDLPLAQLGGADLVWVIVRPGVRQKMRRAEAVARGLLAADSAAEDENMSAEKKRPAAANKMRGQAGNKKR